MKTTIASIITACFLSSCELASISSTPTTTTLVGKDGSTAIITPDGFTWVQNNPTPEAEATGEVILITDDGK